eukprot:gene55437-36281_t
MQKLEKLQEANNGVPHGDIASLASDILHHFFELCKEMPARLRDGLQKVFIWAIRVRAIKKLAAPESPF